MELALGARRVDLATSFVVIGSGAATIDGADGVLGSTAVRRGDGAEAGLDDVLVLLTHVGACDGPVVEQVRSWLGDHAAAARRAGVASDRLVLDAGIHTKPWHQALALLGETASLAEIGYPVAVSLLGSCFADLGTRVGAQTAAMTLGCRVVVADHSAEARRVGDALLVVLR